MASTARHIVVSLVHFRALDHRFGNGGRVPGMVQHPRAT
jgi:hypothetical protein